MDDNNLRELALKEDVQHRGDIISKALQAGLPLKKTFGNLSDLFPEVTVSSPFDEIPLFNHPVSYKVYFSPTHSLGSINYFYVFAFIKQGVKPTNIYFQSASIKDRPNVESGYCLQSGLIKFEAVKSAFLDANCSFVSISDPGHFFEGAASGFYMGNSRCDFAEYIANFLDKLLSKHNLSYRKTLLFGSSAGSMGALMVGGLMKRKVNVLSVNSQIQLLDRTNLLAKFWGSIPQRQLETCYAKQISCFERYKLLSKNSTCVPNIYMLCNARDELHSVNLSFFNFLVKRFSSSNNENQFIFDSYFGVEGHARPEPESLKKKIGIARRILTMSSTGNSLKSTLV